MFKARQLVQVCLQSGGVLRAAFESSADGLHLRVHALHSLLKGPLVPQDGVFAHQVLRPFQGSHPEQLIDAHAEKGRDSGQQGDLRRSAARLPSGNRLRR